MPFQRSSKTYLGQKKQKRTCARLLLLWTTVRAGRRSYIAPSSLQQTTTVFFSQLHRVWRVVNKFCENVALLIYLTCLTYHIRSLQFIRWKLSMKNILAITAFIGEQGFTSNSWIAINSAQGSKMKVVYADVRVRFFSFLVAISAVSYHMVPTVERQMKQGIPVARGYHEALSFIQLGTA